MKLSKLWKVGAVAALIGLAAVAASCSSSPKVAQTLILQADTVVSWHI